MAEQSSFFSRYKLVYRRSSALLKCAVLATLILSAVALITVQIGIEQYRQQTELLRLEAAALERDNQHTQDRIDQLGTVQSVKDIAKEELGLVEPGSFFFDVELD